MISGNGEQGDFRALESGPTLLVSEIRGFEVMERLGKGGMGEVYLARQLTLDRLVAIKFLVAGEADPGQDLARFRLEAELMAKVSHPNILPIHDFGEAEGRPYLVMEYVDGGDLRRCMPKGIPLPLDRVRAVVLPVGEALAYLHAQGIIHRDLKPENILLHDGELPRVADFGIATLREGSASLTQTGWSLGTLGYIAPEQQYRLNVDERADQYSLAALSYEMLTGHLPLGVFPRPSELNPQVGPELDAVILKALQENPKDRFATMQDFMAALDRGLSAAPPRARRRVAPWLVGALAVLAIAGISITADAVWRGKPAAVRDHPAPPPLGPGVTEKTVVTPAPAQTAAKTICEQLKELRARKIWESRGSPVGLAGEAVKDEIWVEASGQVEQELKELAYAIWQSRGSPSGAAGEAVKDEIWHEAERREYTKVTGKAPPDVAAAAK